MLNHLHREKDHGHCFLPTGALHEINEAHKANIDDMRDYARVRVWLVFALLHSKLVRAPVCVVVPSVVVPFFMFCISGLMDNHRLDRPSPFDLLGC